MQQDKRRRKGQTKERLCLGCRRLFSKEHLLRVGALKDGRVMMDERQTIGGARGVCLPDNGLPNRCLQKSPMGACLAPSRA